MEASTWCPERCQGRIVQESNRQNMDGSQISCAALRILALNSREQLIREQREDPELGHIYRYLENPDDGSVNATVCEGWSQDFKLIDGLLFYAKYSTTLGELIVYIPKYLREAIMQEFHDLPLAGHLGKKKTYLKLRDICYFPYMRKYRGISYREIAKIVGRSHSCVQKIIGRFKSDGLIENKSGRGRKSILSDVAKRKVLKDIKIGPKLSAVKLTAETSRIMGRSVSAEIVRNVIRHAGYSSRKARKKAFISLQNQKKHLEFAKTHQLKTELLEESIFSKFNIFGSDGHRTVWRKPNTALDLKNLRPTVKQGGGSVMQDNDSKHTARNVKVWCLFHCKQQLHTPPQSPDIYVIENLWATLEVAVQKHQIRNKAHLKQVLQEEWDKISPDTTKKLVESVPRRLEDIIKAKEHATRY
ncbi:transposable element Tc1 transposase [Trichonephila clavipes]|nr:transposable element Tc1 transposase [Trichonephila clavipes]